MSESNKNKEQSPLIKSVIALNDYFAELERVGAKINSMELKSEFDFEHIHRLISRFAECGQGVSTEVSNLSNVLSEARVRAEELAKGVAEKAEQLNARKNERREKLDEFRVLGEKVKEISMAMTHLRRPEGTTLTDSDRAHLKVALAEIEAQLNPLIEHAQKLRKDAQISKMRFLEQNADALTQTLKAIRQKLGGLGLPSQMPH